MSWSCIQGSEGEDERDARRDDGKRGGDHGDGKRDRRDDGGTLGDSERDENSFFIHFPAEVVVFDPRCNFPWRLFGVFEWAKRQEARNFWRYFH